MPLGHGLHVMSTPEPYATVSTGQSQPSPLSLGLAPTGQRVQQLLMVEVALHFGCDRSKNDPSGHLMHIPPGDATAVCSFEKPGGHGEHSMSPLVMFIVGSLPGGHLPLPQSAPVNGSLHLHSPRLRLFSCGLSKRMSPAPASLPHLQRPLFVHVLAMLSVSWTIAPGQDSHSSPKKLSSHLSHMSAGIAQRDGGS